MINNRAPYIGLPLLQFDEVIEKFCELAIRDHFLDHMIQLIWTLIGQPVTALVRQLLDMLMQWLVILGEFKQTTPELHRISNPGSTSTLWQSVSNLCRQSCW